MKQYLLLLYLLVNIATKAQTPAFAVDCGNNTFFCERPISDTTLHIGKQIKLLNGVAPYKYTWSCKPFKPSSKLTFTASDFLSDTSIANPYIKDIPVRNEPWCFYLSVEDNNNNIATDSISIEYSQFIFYTFEIDFTLNIGDSLQFYYNHFVGGGIPPVKYYWTPSDGLEDSTRIDTWCKPQQSAIYYQYIIDSAGCISERNLAYRINVITTSINEKIYKSSNPINLRQDGKRLIFSNPQNKKAKLSFYSIDGKMIHIAETKDQFFEIPSLVYKSNVTICVISLGGINTTLKLY